MIAYNNKLGIADIVVQVILILPVLAGAIGGFFKTEWLLVSLFFQIFLGAYQLVGGIIGTAKGREWKAKYLIASILYIILGAFLFVMLEEARWSSPLIFNFVIFLSVGVPIIIAIVYLFLCIRDHRKYTVNEIEEYDDLLDA